jgi:MerR family transcriptional regulator, thiopeptide resistance regulator
VSETYRVHEFADLAGVTVKALHHYDRLGLLCPRRTESGYRMYRHEDLDRLEQIVALKFLGLPLKEIKSLLDQDALPLPQALQLQRQVLEQKRQALDRALAAIARAAADIESGDKSAALKNLIEVIAMESGIGVMKRYFRDDIWPKWRRYFEQWPSPEWQALYRDAAAALGSDPAADAAQSLVERWKTLLAADVSGDPAGRERLMKAFMSRRDWPPELRTRQAAFDLDAVNRFVNEAAWARWDADRRNSGFTEKQVPGTTSAARIALFNDVEAALDAAPASDRAQALRDRWESLIEVEAGGDADARAMTLDAWSRRQAWPLGMRQWIAGLYGASLDRWERYAAFIDAARAAHCSSP